MPKSSKSVFSAELLKFIEEWKDKPGNLIMILHRVQEEQGYISNEAAMEVAERTGIPVARVFGVVSFYQGLIGDRTVTVETHFAEQVVSCAVNAE